MGDNGKIRFWCPKGKATEEQRAFMDRALSQSKATLLGVDYELISVAQDHFDNGFFFEVTLGRLKKTT